MIDRVRANITFAQRRLAEGGPGLVLRRGAAKAVRAPRDGMSTWSSRMRSAIRESRLRDRQTGAADDDSLLARVAEVFEPEWYLAYHGVPRTGGSDGALQHYWSTGARHGFSPSPDFDELAYRAAHPRVAKAIRRGEVGSGFEYHLRFGEAGGRTTFPIEEGGSDASTDPLQGPLASVVRGEFDPVWYMDAYADVAALVRRGDVPSPLWHYVTSGAHTARSPNAWFEEPWYLRSYQDVAGAMASGSIPCGFVHFLAHGRREGRRTNPHAPTASGVVLNELTTPIGIDRLDALDAKLRPLPFRVHAPTGHRRVNFVVPTLNRNLMFAGYIAALNFLERLLDRGWKLRILVVDDPETTVMGVRQQFANDPLGAGLFRRAALVNLTQRNHVLDISADDSFIAYSMWSAYHADRLAAAVGRRFVFFLQEFEPAFHPHDGLHAFGAAAYAKPHFALFNSEFLRRYFAREGLGVYADGDDAGDRCSTVFEHTLAVPTAPNHDEIAPGGTNRLLFYARPESHAGRNLFEVGVAGLRCAVDAGVFGDDWTFRGVGSLATETTLPLGAGHQLEITPRLSLGDYAGALRGFDVGLSLQYTPHPGVVHFEMAASGTSVVTNTFSNRSRADLLGVSSNLVPVPPRPEEIASGLAVAVARSKDVEARVAGAAGTWPRSWAESFPDSLMARVEAELR